MKRVLQELLRYGLASGLALVLDVALLALLVNYLGWWYLTAATASFLAGMGVAYLLSVKLVFSERRVARRSVEFAGFAVLGAIGLGVNAGVMFIAVKCFGSTVLLAKGSASCCTFACNFISRRQLLFVRRPAL